jgi:crotonobetainyl-CoA:carnitine CoA-transferase CaiB-like acyl-CoA transferase
MTELVQPGERGAGALDGVRVVEVGGGLSAAFAARLLGDLGADVVKVESPDGDPARGAAPFGVGPDGERRSALFEFANWNKRSVVLQPGERAASASLRRLLLQSDIVIAPASTCGLSAYDVDVDVLRSEAPQVTVVTVSDFGATGPQADWQATDLILYAMSGVMQISGTSDREPLKHGLRQSVWIGGLNAAYSAVAAYYGALATGAGAHLDLSVRECLASELVVNEASYAFAGAVQARRPAVPDPLDGDPLPSADGFVSIQTTPILPIDRLADLFGDERLKRPEFATATGRVAHAEELRAILDEHLSIENSREFFVRACSSGFLAGFVQGAAEMLDCPQLTARDVFHRAPAFGEDGRDWQFPARLVNLTATPMSVRRPAPALGAHTQDVLVELGDGIRVSDGPPAADDMAAHEARGPLAGLRVIDLSTVFAVPYIGGLLADLGAEVIKVEPPRRLDQTRSGWGICFDNDPGDAYWDRASTFHQLNRGKRSVSIDLGTEEGREVLRGLVARSDILLDNFTPRVMRKWGTTYEELKAINPRLVMLSNTGYGSTGPWSSFKAQGTVLEATMGITQYTGYPGGKPSKVGQSHPDFLACWAGLLALLSALVHRRRSGEGQWIDLGMYQLSPFVMPEALLHVQATGTELERRGNEDLGSVLSGVYPAAGHDRWLAVSVAEDAGLERLIDAMGAAAALSGLPSQASQRRDAAERLLREWASGRDAVEAASELQAAGIAAGPVADARDLLTDRGLLAREFYELVSFDGLGRRPLIGRPYSWEGETTAVHVRGPGPDWGSDNDYVLRELLAYDEDRIASLYETGVVATAPIDAAPAHVPDLAMMVASGVLSSVDEHYVTVLDDARDATAA